MRVSFMAREGKGWTNGLESTCANQEMSFRSCMEEVHRNVSWRYCACTMHSLRNAKKHRAWGRSRTIPPTIRASYTMDYKDCILRTRAKRSIAPKIVSHLESHRELDRSRRYSMPARVLKLLPSCLHHASHRWGCNRCRSCRIARSSSKPFGR